MSDQILSNDDLLKQAYPKTDKGKIAKAKSLIREMARNDEEMAMIYHLLDWKEHEASCKERGKDPGQWLDIDGKHAVPAKMARYYRTRCNTSAGVIV